MHQDLSDKGPVDQVSEEDPKIQRNHLWKASDNGKLT